MQCEVVVVEATENQECEIEGREIVYLRELVIAST